MLKNTGNLSPERIEALFYSNIGWFSPFRMTNFLQNASNLIRTSFEIEIASDSHFIEYGTLILEDVSISAFGIDFELSPIGLLYTYNPQKQIWEALLELFSNWHDMFGITAPTSQNSLFKISDETEVGKKFWDNLENETFSSGNPSLFGTISDSTLDEIRSGTEFSSIRINDRNTFSFENSSDGLAFNFGNFVQSNQSLQLWILTFQFDNITIEFWVARSARYRSAFFNNENHRQIAIER